MTNQLPDTIIILTPAFPRNESETWWVPSQQLMVSALHRRYPDLHIEVVSLLYPREATQYRWQDLPIHSINGLQYAKFRRPLRWRASWKQLKQLQQQQKVIGLLSFWCGECALIGTFFGKKYGIRHISWICGQDAGSSNPFPRFIRPKPTELAAMSHFLATEFHRNHRVKPAFIIPNAIDTTSFPAAAGIERDIDIAGIGSFEPLKRYPMWVEIIAQLKKSFASIKAVHCGMGVEQELCAHLIEKLRLDDNCFLSGPQPHEAILQMLHRTKILLHTSRYEGCSTVCLEALYAGAKVISFCYPFDHPVPNWHVVNNKDEMIEKALQLLSDADLSYQSTLVHSMDDSADAMMQLFGVRPHTVPQQMQAYSV